MSDNPNNPVPKGQARGPRRGWGNWRANRTDKIANPRRNKAAQQLAKPKKPDGDPPA